MSLRQGGQSTTLVKNGRKKIHTTFPDDSEMVEEYDETTLELLERKRRTRNALGKEMPWVYEVGMPQEAFNPESSILKESTANPIFSRKDTRANFEWRVRNLCYPADTYSVTIDPKDNKIVIRTSNKKYYKRFDIPELNHLSHELDESSLQWKHANNTLHITYTKPPEVLLAEKETQMDLKKVKPHNAAGVPADGDPAECKQQ